MTSLNSLDRSKLGVGRESRNREISGAGGEGSVPETVDDGNSADVVVPIDLPCVAGHRFTREISLGGRDGN